MQRNEALLLFEKFMVRFKHSKYHNLVKSLYIFGSFSKGSPEPNDIDLLAVLETDRSVRSERFGNTIIRDILGNLQNIDLLVCNEKEFEEFIGFTFTKNDLRLVWPDVNPNSNWQSVVNCICPVNVNYKKEKAFQYKEFHASYPLKVKFRTAVEKKIIKVRELSAEEFYLDQGPWNYEIFYEDESGEVIRETVNECEEIKERLIYHGEQGTSSQYLKTLQVLYSYAHKNEIYLEEDILYSRHLHRPYETFLISDDETIIFRLYNIDLDDSLYNLDYSQSIEQVVLIPRYKVRSKNNFIYEIRRGENWSPENLRFLDEVYNKACNSPFQG